MPLRFAFALHDHQPVGNFDGVFESSYRDGYAPFLELIEQYQEIPVSLHTSGCLMEWLVARHPEYVERLKRMVDRGQLELFSQVLYLVQNNYVDPPDNPKLVKGAIDGMLKTLDPHTVYLPPQRAEKMDEDFRGDYSGIGISFDLRDGVIVVISPLEGTPAFVHGLGFHGRRLRSRCPALSQHPSWNFEF